MMEPVALSQHRGTPLLEVIKKVIICASKEDAFFMMDLFLLLVKDYGLSDTN